MLNRRFTVSAGVLLVVFSAVAYLAINMDDSRFLSNSSVQTAAPEAPVFFQQVQPNNALTGGLTFNFTKFNNLTQGIVNQKFN